MAGLSREEAKRTIEAVEAAYAAGYRPTAVLTAAAKSLGISRRAINDRVHIAAGMGIAPDFVFVPPLAVKLPPPIKPASPEPAFILGASKYLSRKDDTYVFGAVSDNHLGSRYERLDVLNDLYDKFSAAGVDRVYNAGNWIEGESRFNHHELLVHGMDAQLRYLAKNYPSRPNITTYAVSGDDHEGWYSQREGIDIGAHAENIMRSEGREDWVNLGYMEAHIRLQNANSGSESIMACVQPGGGSTYAVSYTVQKIIESLDGGEKPAVGLYGHYHKLMAMNIRNVWVLQTGTTKDQDSFMRKKRIEAHVGGTIVTLKQDRESGAITGFTPEMHRYFTRGFYGPRFSHAGNVVLPDRGVESNPKLVNA
mgnify:CR=1 FL=1